MAARHRRERWCADTRGGLATFHMLDTRQYRNDQACGDEIRTDCIERLDPYRSLHTI
jgi:phosphodiesterase/alkaline phosphatase D-like protein